METITRIVKCDIAVIVIKTSCKVRKPDNYDLLVGDEHMHDSLFIDIGDFNVPRSVLNRFYDFTGGRIFEQCAVSYNVDNDRYHLVNQVETDESGTYAWMELCKLKINEFSIYNWGEPIGELYTSFNKKHECLVEN